ncbi:hypothetical protein PAXINDRAFT_15522 [Paxillus involutus ATCC 200175]|uniref:Uncharacterized protein n=1 Tax=Paxillus involutus ATCC 200175 TaxID=664439 RepID=A0A0C9TV40_PAXIN|nr:hypothetical protein PAXINDRAFT_15522 [Paxillus involutus ATCC 200175]
MAAEFSQQSQWCFLRDMTEIAAMLSLQTSQWPLSPSAFRARCMLNSPGDEEETGGCDSDEVPGGEAVGETAARGLTLKSPKKSRKMQARITAVAQAK